MAEPNSQSTQLIGLEAAVESVCEDAECDSEAEGTENADSARDAEDGEEADDAEDADEAEDGLKCEACEVVSAV